MAERFKAPSASILMLMKQEGGKRKVLLQRRQNTGFADGLWDLSCSGHVEHGESMSQAIVREAREELGIEIDANSLSFVTFVHKRESESDLTYYNAYFACFNYLGEPRICENEKCSELKWFDLDDLPEDIIDDRRRAVEAFKSGVHYIEYGWQ